MADNINKSEGKVEKFSGVYEYTYVFIYVHIV